MELTLESVENPNHETYIAALRACHELGVAHHLDAAVALATALDWLIDAPNTESWLAFVQRNHGTALTVLR